MNEEGQFMIPESIYVLYVSYSQLWQKMNLGMVELL